MEKFIFIFEMIIKKYENPLIFLIYLWREKNVLWFSKIYGYTREGTADEMKRGVSEKYHKSFFYYSKSIAVAQIECH